MSRLRIQACLSSLVTTLADFPKEAGRLLALRFQSFVGVCDAVVVEVVMIMHRALWRSPALVRPVLRSLCPVTQSSRQLAGAANQIEMQAVRTALVRIQQAVVLLNVPSHRKLQLSRSNVGHEGCMHMSTYFGLSGSDSGAYKPFKGSTSNVKVHVYCKWTLKVETFAVNQTHARGW